MKKIAVLAIFAGAMSFASCKKNYTCTCTTTEPGYPNITSSTTIKDTKSKAKTTCSNESATVGSVATTCAIQ
jgi:hypothetical protein